jgi:hypothetical protein
VIISDVDMILRYSKFPPPSTKAVVSLNADASEPSAGETVYAFGHGRTISNDPGSVSQQLKGLETDVQACPADYSDAIEQHICIFTPGGGVCRGDGGGPIVTSAVTSNPNSAIQLGIASYMINGCANDAFPDVYLRVSFFQDFINEHICDNSASKPASCPTLSPTKPPTPNPTPSPTSPPPTIFTPSQPTQVPTSIPTQILTSKPTQFPTLKPTSKPTASPTERIVRVVAVVERGGPSADDLQASWTAFDNNWPDRTFCILKVGGVTSVADLLIPADMALDPNVLSKQVNRDNGDRLEQSDWFDLCFLNEVMAGTPVALLVDLAFFDVPASYEYFLTRIADAGLQVVDAVRSPDQNYISPLDRLFVPGN